ncbi:MAG: hypothetical protein WAL63_11815 [Solirubrobacteraceae bacterium]
MARLTHRDGQLVLSLSAIEKVAALNGDVRAPLTKVRAIRLVKPWTELRGLRSPGTAIPTALAYGTFRWRGNRDFAAIRGGNRVLEVRLAQGQSFARLLVTESSPRATRRRLWCASTLARSRALFALDR